MNEVSNSKPARFTKVDSGWYATEDGKWAVVIEVGMGAYVSKARQDYAGEANDGWALVASSAGDLREDHQSGETIEWYPTKRAAVAEGQRRIANLERTQLRVTREEQQEAVRTSPVFASFTPETREQITKSVPTLEEKMRAEREREAIVKSLKRSSETVRISIENRDEKLVLAHRAGSSLRQLAEATGLGVETVRRTLIAKGVATA